MFAEATSDARVVVVPARVVSADAVVAAVVGQHPSGTRLDRDQRRLPAGGLTTYHRRGGRWPDVGGGLRGGLGALVERRDDPEAAVEQVLLRLSPEGIRLAQLAHDVADGQSGGQVEARLPGTGVE